MTQQAKIPLGISSCLNSSAVRYDASTAKVPTIVKKMAGDYAFNAFCPELIAGMGVPREPIRLVESSDGVSVRGSKSAEDKTAELQQAAVSIVKLVEKSQLRGFIVKSKSPSCGLSSAKIYNEEGYIQGKRAGLFTEKLQNELLIPIIEAEMLNCPRMADRFLRLVSVADAFYQMGETPDRQQLIDTYVRFKLALMASSPEHYRMAGRLVADMKGKDLQRVKNSLYLVIFEGMNILSLRGRHANALMHLQGYFKRALTPPEKKELTLSISDYAKGGLPLTVPLTLIRHYLLLHPDSYLLQQYYIANNCEHYGLRNSL